MIEDKFEFGSIDEFDLKKFANWILKDMDKINFEFINFIDVWNFYQLKKESNFISRRNYNEWVVWSDSDKDRSYILYPCLTHLLDIDRIKDKSAEDAD